MTRAGPVRTVRRMRVNKQGVRDLNGRQPAPPADPGIHLRSAAAATQAYLDASVGSLDKAVAEITTHLTNFAPGLRQDAEEALVLARRARAKLEIVTRRIP